MMQVTSNIAESYLIQFRLYHDKTGNKGASTQRETREKRLFCEKTF